MSDHNYKDSANVTTRREFLIQTSAITAGLSLTSVSKSKGLDLHKLYSPDAGNLTVSIFVNGKKKPLKLTRELPFLVGCDGASGPIRHQMGLSFEGDTVPKIFYVADVILKSPVINKNELFMFMIIKGFVLFFPMEGETWCVSNGSG